MSLKLQESYISLNNLRFHACHGVGETERTVGGDFTVSLRLRCDVGRAMATDDVADAVDYSEVYRIVAGEMARPARLLEHVAARVAESVAKRFPQIVGVDIRLTKLNPPMGADGDGASVELHLINDKTTASKAAVY